MQTLKYAYEGDLRDTNM